jgi:hypothetical protein
MRSRKHELGGRCIFGKNLFSKGQLAIWKGLPKGFDILPYLVASMQRNTPRKHELNVRLLVSEISLNIPGVEGCHVAVKDLLCVCCILICHPILLY